VTTVGVHLIRIQDLGIASLVLLICVPRAVAGLNTLIRKPAKRMVVVFSKLIAPVGSHIHLMYRFDVCELLYKMIVIDVLTI
jgi:hypothetical protein